MTERINVYIIGLDKTSNFVSDVYCMKKIKDLDELKIKLDSVFAEDFEKFPGVKKYCSDHQIEAINLNPDENHFIEILRYSVNNIDKKNLATLISEKGIFKLNFLFKQDLCFNSHII